MDAEGTLGEVALNEGEPPLLNPDAGPEGVLEGDPRAQGPLGKEAHRVASLAFLKGGRAAVSEEGTELLFRDSAGLPKETKGLWGKALGLHSAYVPDAVQTQA